MFGHTRTYQATFQHVRGPIRLRDVCLSDAAFRDSKSLARELRAAGTLLPGARVRSFTGEAGHRVVAYQITPGLSTQTGHLILEPVQRDHASYDAILRAGPAEQGQTIDAGDVVIETTLRRLG